MNFQQVNNYYNDSIYSTDSESEDNDNLEGKNEKHNDCNCNICFKESDSEPDLGEAVSSSSDEETDDNVSEQNEGSNGYPTSDYLSTEEEEKQSEMSDISESDFEEGSLEHTLHVVKKAAYQVLNRPRLSCDDVRKTTKLLLSTIELCQYRNQKIFFIVYLFRLMLRDEFGNLYFVSANIREQFPKYQRLREVIIEKLNEFQHIFQLKKLVKSIKTKYNLY